jgi:hypothetical protein
MAGAGTAAGSNLLIKIGSYAGGWPIQPSDAAAQLAAIQGVLNGASNLTG